MIFGAKIDKLELDEHFESGIVHLKGGAQIKYHALVLANGSSSYQKNLNQRDVLNIFLSKDIEHRHLIKQKLSRSNKILIRHLNLESLEIASSIKNKNPNAKILILDEAEGQGVFARMNSTLKNQFLENFKKNDIFVKTKSPIKDIYDLDDYVYLVLENNKKKMKFDMMIENNEQIICNNDLFNVE